MAEHSHQQHRPPVGQDPATATPPTQLGYLYPDNDILAVVDDRATGERDIIQGYVDEAENGHCLVMVHAAEPSLIESARQVLVSIGARDLHHWERFTITRLSERL